MDRIGSDHHHHHHHPDISHRWLAHQPQRCRERGLRYAGRMGCEDTVLKVMDNWSDECPGNCFRDQYGGSINDSSADAGREWNISFPPKRGCIKYIQGRVWTGWFPFLIWGGTSAKKKKKRVLCVTFKCTKMQHDLNLCSVIYRFHNRGMDSRYKSQYRVKLLQFSL